MSTAVTFADGITRFVTFEKTVADGWRFTWGTRSFMAWRDPAGFSHRDWVLYEYDGKGGIFAGQPDIIIADQLDSRAACVEAAKEAYDRGN